MYSYVGPPTPTDKAGWLRVRFQRVTPPPGEDEITVRLSNQTFELLKGRNNIPRSDLLDAEGT
jgi:hypothetical protein